ncbi:MAG: CYTH domain-containing protein, partial [Candidatus Taylorbacteria bacterium]|nr:CYTH domain-containing protein [Candidatus Taylorbacteria bacterium]
HMAHEIETKVLAIDQLACVETLQGLGAQKVLETRLAVTWYRQRGVKNGEDPWFLRIRSTSEGIHEVTWKARSTIIGTARKHKEINFTIHEPEHLADLFLELGLEAYAHQEKDRLSFTYKNWRFDFDTYPHVPPFLEIEGVSEAHVNEAIALLSLQQNGTWAKGERTLIEEVYKRNWYAMRF